MFSFSVSLPFKCNKISADNLCIHTKHNFPSCALPAALQSEKQIMHFLLHGYEWVHLFLEDRERRVKGLERKGRNQMQPISLPLWKEKHAGIRFLQYGLNPTLMYLGGG